MATTDLLVERFSGGRWRSNCYLVTLGRQALVIDPGQAASEVAPLIESRGLEVVAVLCTHGHFDHVEGAHLIREVNPAPLYIHAADDQLMRSASLYRKLFDGTEPVPHVPADAHYEAEDGELVLGPFSVTITHIPGHTEGGVFVNIGDDLFTGDTLLPPKLGRTDLPGGDAAVLERSLPRIVRFAPELRVHPGHGQPTTMARAVADTPQLQALAESV